MSPSPATPPVAPSIAAQQVPLAQYAQNAAASGGQDTGMPSAQSSMALVQSLLTGMGNDATKIAKVLVIAKPELIPILKEVVNALAMLTNQITKEMAPDNGAATQQQAMPDSGAVSASA